MARKGVSVGRRPNGVLGLSLKDRTILFLLILLYKTVSPSDKTVFALRPSPCQSVSYLLSSSPTRQTPSPSSPPFLKVTDDGGGGGFVGDDDALASVSSSSSSKVGKGTLRNNRITSHHGLK